MTIKAKCMPVTIDGASRAVALHAGHATAALHLQIRACTVAGHAQWCALGVTLQLPMSFRGLATNRRGERVTPHRRSATAKNSMAQQTLESVTQLLQRVPFPLAHFGLAHSGLQSLAHLLADFRCGECLEIRVYLQVPEVPRQL